MNGQWLELISKGGETFIVPADRDNKITNVLKWEQTFRILGLSVKLCYMAKGTLFFSFSFHPTSFSVIFFICFLSSSPPSSSSSNLSFYSLPFLFIFLHSLLFLMFTLFLFFVILPCSFLLILFILNLPLHYPLRTLFLL